MRKLRNRGYSLLKVTKPGVAFNQNTITTWFLLHDFTKIQVTVILIYILSATTFPPSPPITPFPKHPFHYPPQCVFTEAQFGMG